MAQQLFTKLSLMFYLLFFFFVTIWQKTRLLRSLFFVNSGCRFYPSCSDYFLHAVKQHGLISGTILFLERFVRCNPLFDGGIDPVNKSYERNWMREAQDKSELHKNGL